MIEQATFWEEALDHMPYSFLVLDRQNTLKEINRKAAEKWGKAKSDLVGKKLEEILDRVALDEALTALEYVRQTGKTLQRRLYLPAFNRWIEGTLVPKEELTLVYLHDISQTHEIEAYLLDEYRRLKEAQKVGRIGSFERDVSAEGVICSEELYRIHGLTPDSETITLQRLISFVHPEDKEAFVEAIRFANATGTFLELTNRIVLADGSIKWIQRRAEVEKNEQGKALRVIGTIQDISDQVIAQQKSKASHQLMLDAEEIGKFGSYEGDVASYTFHFSDGLYKLLGHAPGSFSPTLDLIDARSHPEDVARVRQILKEAADNKDTYEYYRRIYRKDGQLRLLHAHGKVLRDKQGKALKFHGIVYDVTEVKRLEEENLKLKLNQQKALLFAILEAQDEERKRISESLHNGVAQLLYAAKLTLEQISVKTNTSPEEMKAILHKTDTFLKEAIMATRHVSHELVPVLLDQFGLEKSLQEFFQRFSTPGISFQCTVPEERLEKPLKLAIYRISQELINNIIKHSGATRARLDIFREGHTIIIEAQDNGKGLETAPEKWKGIGLKTIHDRAKLLHGAVEIESTPDKGTLITIFLPSDNL